MSKIPTIRFTEVREYYERNQPNGHWFDSDTTGFFRARLPEVAYQTDAGILFITSESRSEEDRRYYSVRRQKVDGRIETVGKFNDYRTRAEAMNALRNLHKGASHVVD
jgi:hypothetical protein